MGAALRIEPSMGACAYHLLSVASALQADLVVVGTHQRSAIARLWEGSVSRAVLRDSTASVVTVPLAGREAGAPVPQVRTVLAATDFW